MTTATRILAKDPEARQDLPRARERAEPAKLVALKQAAHQGWSDIAAERYADVGDNGLADFIGQLGHRAAQRVESPD